MRVILIASAHLFQYLIAGLTKTVHPHRAVWVDIVWIFAKSYSHAVLVPCAKFWT